MASDLTYSLNLNIIEGPRPNEAIVERKTQGIEYRGMSNPRASLCIPQKKNWTPVKDIGPFEFRVVEHVSRWRAFRIEEAEKFVGKWCLYSDKLVKPTGRAAFDRQKNLFRVYVEESGNTGWGHWLDFNELVQECAFTGTNEPVGFKLD